MAETRFDERAQSALLHAEELDAQWHSAYDEAELHLGEDDDV